MVGRPLNRSPEIQQWLVAVIRKVARNSKTDHRKRKGPGALECGNNLPEDRQSRKVQQRQ